VIVWLGDMNRQFADFVVFFVSGVNIVGDVREPGYLEGGDFCPASADLAFVGVGLRSNFEAVQQLMDEDLFGYRRVAVVRDDYEQNQVGAQPTDPALQAARACPEVAARDTQHSEQPQPHVILLAVTHNRCCRYACRTACTWTACSASLATTCAS
jgi:Arginine deiminase